MDESSRELVVALVTIAHLFYKGKFAAAAGLAVSARFLRYDRRVSFSGVDRYTS